MTRYTLPIVEEPGEPQRLGAYRLLRAIGRGGMGTVFLARRDDERYEREVAVKVLRSGLEDTELRRRFLAERQILARLEHPNIARLYDGGETVDGRPYLVMELVEGLPIDEHCDRHRLAVEERLALFLRICSAVQCAHQSLLVHRDLKPANILVTPAGEPKLLDFGIAKDLAPAGEGDPRTRTRLEAMTLSHASPEQVTGAALTTASDVYSLGVVLYGLLAGRSPYRVTAGAPPHELERAIVEEEPEKPSAALGRPGLPPPEEIAAARGSRPAALARRLAGDLDTILLTALAKEPARRYDSVVGLASDLERHLADLPVAARPDTLGYRARKLIRRHRAAVAAAMVLGLLVAALGASLLVQGRRTLEERDKAREALAFLVDTFKQADPQRAKGEALTARDILDQGAARVSRELAGQPEVQAAVMDAIGEVDLGLGRYDAAAPLLERALAIRRRVFGPASLATAESLEHLAALQGERSDLASAEAHLRQALAIRRRRQGDGDLAVARTLNRLGMTLVDQGTSPQSAREAAALHREALAIARRVEGPVGPTVAESLIALTYLERRQGRFAAAEALFRQGLAIERQALGERSLELWRDRSRFGETLIEAGKFQEAEAVLRQCLDMQRQLLGREHPDVASSMRGLAVAIHLQSRYAESEVLERELLAQTRAQYGPTHWRVSEALLNLASDLAGQGKNAAAIPLYEGALAIRRRDLGESHWQVAQVLLLLAEAHGNSQDYPRALQLARQARDAFVAGEGPDHPYTAHALRELGRIYMKQKRFAEAEPFLRRCLEIRQRKLESDHPDLAQARYLLGSCLLGRGRPAEAAPLLRAALATFSTTYGPDHEQTAKAAKLLADAEKKARRTGRFG